MDRDELTVKPHEDEPGERIEPLAMRARRSTGEWEPHVEIRVWAKRARPTPQRATARPGFYMGIKHFNGEEVKVLAVEKITTTQAREIAAACANGSDHVTPIIEQMVQMVMKSLGRVAHQHGLAEKDNSAAMNELIEAEKQRTRRTRT